MEILELYACCFVDRPYLGHAGMVSLTKAQQHVLKAAASAARQHGFRVHPFNVNWYNDFVPKHALDAERHSLGLLLC